MFRIVQCKCSAQYLGNSVRVREPLAKLSPELVEVKLHEVLPQCRENRLRVVGGRTDLGYVVTLAKDVRGACEVKVFEGG
jgi:hypothetical protein